MPQQPQENPMVVHVLSIHKGQNDKDEAHVLGEEQAAYILNLDVRRQGARARRHGVSSQGALNSAPHGTWMAKDLKLDRDNLLFGVYAGEVYAIPGGAVPSKRCAGVSLTSAVHMGIPGRWANRRATYIVQATQCDSSATSTSKIVVLTDINTFTQAIAAMIGACWFQNRLFTGRHSYAGQPYETLWWSELGDGLSYSSYNTLLIEPGIGGNIQQLYPLRGFTPSIVVFKEDAIATLEPKWGSSSSLIPAAGDALDTIKTNIRLISNQIGCKAPLSIQFVPGAPGGDIYFLAKDGIRALTRANDDTVSGVSKLVSDPIQNTIARINYAYAHKAVSAVVDAKYHLAVPLDGATENTHVLVFDLQTEAWSVLNWCPKAMTYGRVDGDALERLYMQYNTQVTDNVGASPTYGYHVYRGYVGRADPGSMPVIFQEDSRAMDFGGIDKKKKWDWLSVSFRNDASETCVVGLQYNVDKRGWVTCGSAVFGAMAGGLDTVLGVTPLPWGLTLGATRTYKFNLTDIDPGYFIQIRYFGTSDVAAPVILDMAVAARPILEEFDNSIT